MVVDRCYFLSVSLNYSLVDLTHYIQSHYNSTVHNYTLYKERHLHIQQLLIDVHAITFQLTTTFHLLK